MGTIFKEYLLYLSLSGFLFMGLLTIMAFFSKEYLRLNKESYINSAICLSITSGVIFF